VLTRAHEREFGTIDGKWQPANLFAMFVFCMLQISYSSGWICWRVCWKPVTSSWPMSDVLILLVNDVVMDAMQDCQAVCE
jgi:hypothetical protein